MTLVNAAYLGIERFANDRNNENWSAGSSPNDKTALIRAVYRQVLGYQYVMDSERLSGAESLFRNGYLSVREFVRTVAKSGLYRAKFFENTNPYHFIELNFKHLLGRAPQGRDEMLHHFTILQEQGYDAEIDSYLDSAEYQERFGEEQVPFLHGWDYSKGHAGRQFSWLMQLTRGAAASVKGDVTPMPAAPLCNRPVWPAPPSPKWPRASARRPVCTGWRSPASTTTACTSAATPCASCPSTRCWRPSSRSTARAVAWPA
jgi:hypothetical protein